MNLPPLKDPLPREGGGAEWIPAGLVAELVGITRQGVHKACMAGRFVWRYVPGESGGRRLEVNLASLPIEAQSAWRMAQSDGGRNGGARAVPAEDPEGAGGAEVAQSGKREARSAESDTAR